MKLQDKCVDLLTAISAVQGTIKSPKKDSKSDQFGGYEYTSLHEVTTKINEAARKHGLVIIQTIDYFADDKIPTLHTVVGHYASGQQLSTICKIPVEKSTAQGLGSGITYMRKYQLMAMFMLAPVDDDGQEASGTTTPRSGKVPSGGPPPGLVDDIPPPEEPPDSPDSSKGVTVEYVMEELGRAASEEELKKARDTYRAFMATKATFDEKKLAKTLIKSKQLEFSK